MSLFLPACESENKFKCVRLESSDVGIKQHNFLEKFALSVFEDLNGNDVGMYTGTLLGPLLKYSF